MDPLDKFNSETAHSPHIDKILEINFYSLAVREKKICESHVSCHFEWYTETLKHEPFDLYVYILREHFVSV